MAGVVRPEDNTLDPTTAPTIHFGRKRVWQVAAGRGVPLPDERWRRLGRPASSASRSACCATCATQYFSSQYAREVYGVVVEGDPDFDADAMRVDEAATAELRGRMRASNAPPTGSSPA